MEQKREYKGQTATIDGNDRFAALYQNIVLQQAYVNKDRQEKAILRSGCVNPMPMHTW